MVQDASLSRIALGARAGLGLLALTLAASHDPPLSRQCLVEVPKTRRQAELMQSSNLIEISPQPEGRVYTRCFCLEEPLGAVSSRIAPAAWHRSPSRCGMLLSPQGGQRSAAALGAWCC